MLEKFNLLVYMKTTAREKYAEISNILGMMKFEIKIIAV